MRYLMFIFSLSLFSTIGQAQDNIPTGTRINLQSFVSATLPNDEVIIIYRIEQTGESASAVRQYVNKVSALVQNRLKKATGVRFKTISRSMQPVWQYPSNAKRVRVGWSMLQTGQAVSSNLDSVPAWLDTIELAGAHLSSLQFRISSSSSRQAQDKLRLQAVAAFRKKSSVIAKGLEAKAFRIINLNTIGQTPQPVIYRGLMSMAKRTSTVHPSVSAGESKISVTIDGTIEIPFTDFEVQ